MIKREKQAKIERKKERNCEKKRKIKTEMIEEEKESRRRNKPILGGEKKKGA